MRRPRDRDRTVGLVRALLLLSIMLWFLLSLASHAAGQDPDRPVPTPAPAAQSQDDYAWMIPIWLAATGGN
jgi:hypothetical protein